MIALTFVPLVNMLSVLLRKRRFVCKGSFKVKDTGCRFNLLICTKPHGRKVQRKKVQWSRREHKSLKLKSLNKSKHVISERCALGLNTSCTCLIRLPEYLKTLSVKDAETLSWSNFTQPPSNAPWKAADSRYTSSSRPSVGPTYTFYHRRIKHDIIAARVAGCQPDRQQRCCHG